MRRHAMVGRGGPRAPPPLGYVGIRRRADAAAGAGALAVPVHGSCIWPSLYQWVYHVRREWRKPLCAVCVLLSARRRRGSGIQDGYGGLNVLPPTRFILSRTHRELTRRPGAHPRCDDGEYATAASTRTPMFRPRPKILFGAPVVHDVRCRNSRRSSGVFECNATQHRTEQNRQKWSAEQRRASRE